MPDFQEVYTVKAPIQKVWDFLVDVSKVCKLIPGCIGAEVLDDKTTIITVQAKVGFISTKFKIKTRLMETNPPHSLMSVGTGEDSRMASFINLRSNLMLKALSEGETKVTFRSQAMISGRLGSLGWGVMKKKAEEMARVFVSDVKKALELSS